MRHLVLSRCRAVLQTVWFELITRIGAFVLHNHWDLLRFGVLHPANYGKVVRGVAGKIGRASYR